MILKTLRAACAHDCPDTCAIRLKVQDELTHQRLADIGRGPSFYDCLVDVRPAADLADLAE